MKKSLICLFISLIFISNLPVKAEVFRGNTVKQWTVESARNETFKDAKTLIDVKAYPARDPQYKRNSIFFEAKTNTKINIEDSRTKTNKEMSVYENGYYCIRVLSKNLFDKVFVYDKEGDLKEVVFFLFPYNCTLEGYIAEKAYPSRFYRHKYPTGELISVGVHVSAIESYLFNLNASLFVHCISTKCYGPDGEIVIEGTSYEK